MCIEVTNNMLIAKMEFSTKSPKKVSYSVKKLLKQIFKQHKVKELVITENMKNSKTTKSVQALESLENLRNSDIENICLSIESYENKINERLSASYDIEDYEIEDLQAVPIHFVRNELGTFFWTAACEIPADNDLIEPLHCCTTNQIATSKLEVCWAQA